MLAPHFKVTRKVYRSWPADHLYNYISTSSILFSLFPFFSLYIFYELLMKLLRIEIIYLISYGFGNNIRFDKSPQTFIMLDCVL